MFDIVYTYVNGNDPSHVDSKHEAMNVLLPEPESSDSCRFNSSCEIVFSLFSLYRCLDKQQLHKIYVVISDHNLQTISFDYPEWIATHQSFMEFLTKYVEYVTHAQIIPIQFLPTFNSHVIELYLSNIPGLLEQYIYFNDDCFMGAPTAESFFFTQEEKASKAHIFLSSAPMKMATQAKMATKLSLFQSIMNKTFDLLQQRFVTLRQGTATWNKCHHQAKALLKSSCQATLKDPVFATAIHQLSSRKFRSRLDFAPIELMAAYMYFTGKGKTLEAKPYTFYMEWSQDESVMQKRFYVLLNWPTRPNLICINDIPADVKQQQQTTVNSKEQSKERQRWKIAALSDFAHQYFQQEDPSK